MTPLPNTIFLYSVFREKNFNETKDILFGIRGKRDLNILRKGFFETRHPNTSIDKGKHLS